MLLYIHVPFCRSRCKYCAFYSQALQKNHEPETSIAIRDYIDTLMLEMACWRDRLGSISIESVFFGGGTPSLLPVRMVGMLIDKIHGYFSLQENAEITLEANPESLRGTLQPNQYLSAGINRLSIGIQSLDGLILHKLGRIHKEQDSLQSFLAAREAGFPNISVDLMWGLPNQSVRQWLQTLKDIVRLAPEHISAYGLTLEPGTPMEKEVREGRMELPPERDQNIMFLEGSSFLESHGYMHYEISNFARMGYQCRHNMGYWTGEEYLGLGPSATSTLQNHRWTNPANQETWDERVRSGEFMEDVEELTPLVQVLERMMLSLRTSQGLSFHDYHEMTQRDFLRDHNRLVHALHENGLVRIRNGYMRLTTKGMLVSNAILANLFEHTKKVLTTPLTSRPRVQREESERNETAIRKVIWPRV